MGEFFNQISNYNSSEVLQLLVGLLSLNNSYASIELFCPLTFLVCVCVWLKLALAARLTWGHVIITSWLMFYVPQPKPQPFHPLWDTGSVHLQLALMFRLKLDFPPPESSEHSSEYPEDDDDMVHSDPDSNLSPPYTPARPDYSDTPLSPASSPGRTSYYQPFFPFCSVSPTDYTPISPTYS